MRHINDEHIIRLLAVHDPRGMEALFDCYYRPLVLWADTFLNNVPAAEDLIQEMLVAFWEKKLYQRLSPDKLRGYIFTSARNLALNVLQKRDPLRNAAKVDAGDIAALWLEPEDITEEVLRAIETEIEKLPPRTKQVLKAVYIDGLKYSEAALRFQISVATVKTLLVNAIKRLRAALSRFFSHY
jgi:RNA polymerase sigma-70 factor (ECF subfamily)